MRRFGIVVITCCVILLFWSPLVAVAQSLRKEIENSKLAEAAKPIGELLRLVELDGKVSILKNWDLTKQRESAYQTEEEKLEALVEEYVDRGMQEAIARRLAENRLGHGGKPSVIEQFSELQSFFRAGGSGGGGGGGGGTWRRRFVSGSFTGYLTLTKTLHRFRFIDDEFRVELEVREWSDGAFLLRFAGTDGMVELNQTNERVRLAVIRDENASVFVAKDFPELKSEHRLAVEKYLFPLMKSVGISYPMSFANPAVVTSAMEKLNSLQRDEMEVVTWLDALGSESDGERDEAERALTLNFYKWKELVNMNLGDYSFDDDAAARLDKVRGTAPGTDIQDYVNMLNLSEPRTLLELWEKAPEESHRTIIEQLKTVSGLSLGDDIGEWKKMVDKL